MATTWPKSFCLLPLGLMTFGLDRTAYTVEDLFANLWIRVANIALKLTSLSE